jgi:hypothetical protein
VVCSFVFIDRFFTQVASIPYVSRFVSRIRENPRNIHEYACGFSESLCIKIPTYLLAILVKNKSL